MYYLPGKRPFGFIGHPRTASRAVRAALVAAGASAPGGHHQAHHPTINAIHDAGGLVACTVRNPYDLVVSWYFYQEENVKQSFELSVRPFDEWLESAIAGEEGTASRFMKDPFYGYSLCDCFIWFEGNIQQQLNSILARCGVSPVIIKYEERWKTDRLPYKEVYSPLSRQLVEHAFQREIHELGYSF